MDSLLGLLQRRRDWIAVLVLAAAVLLHARFFVDFDVPPFEDAAMLMRYADHVARGYGVVWNIGQPPVDGATDFLFMVAVGALKAAGVGTGRAVRVLGITAHLLTVLLVYVVNRRIWRAGVAVSILTALFLAVGTGAWYVAAYFGTPVFGFFGALTWAIGLWIIRRERASLALALAFGLSGLATALIRPEGVILAATMLISVVIVRGWRESRKLASVFGAVFLVLGGAYFLWHWDYFGYLLPNPFYKKGGGLVHWDSFWESLANLLRFGAPFLLAFVLGLRSSRAARLTLAFLLPLVVFASSFVLVSNETNFGGRFQYALLPLVLTSCYPLVEGIAAEWGLSWSSPLTSRARLVWVVFGVAAAYGLLRYSAAQSCSLTAAQQTCGVAFEADGRYDLAKVLAEYKDRGYVLATSEAGLLPLYSGWFTVDTWGLNDSWIAHHGEVTEAYLDSYSPHLIVFHAYFSPVVPPRINEKNMAQDWFRMTITLKTYAETRGYTLAAAFGDSPYESHYYYVRRDFPDSDRILHAISSMKDYSWYTTGRRAINYAILQAEGGR